MEQIGVQKKPKNWLVESILTTIFCCLPFGVAGIIFASRVDAAYKQGDLVGAEEASKQAGKWTKIAFFLGIAVCVLMFLAIIGFGITFGILEEMERVDSE